MRLRDWLLWIVLAPFCVGACVLLYGVTLSDEADPVVAGVTRTVLAILGGVLALAVIAALGVLLRRTKEMHASIRRFERMAEETNALLADQGQETAGHRGRSVVAQHPGEARPRAAR